MENHISKVKIASSKLLSVVLTIVSVIWVAFFALGIIGNIAMPDNGLEGSFYGFAFFLLAIGIAGIVVAARMRKRIKLLNTYSRQLTVDPLHSLDLLAAATNESVDVVRTQLTKLIDKGFIKDAFIDMERNCLVLVEENGQGVVDRKEIYVTPSPTAVQAVPAVVKCGGCGAVNKVMAGQPSACEYCGAPIIG